MIAAALDISKTRTGWCVGGPLSTQSARPPRYGSLGFTGDRYLANFGKWVDGLIREHGVTHMFFEEPIRGINYDSARALMGMVAVAEEWAGHHGIMCREMPIGTWRKHFLGHGGMRREDAKQAALTRCKQLGYAPLNHDQAEAIGIWDTACAMLNPRHGVYQNVIFRGVS